MNSVMLFVILIPGISLLITILFEVEWETRAKIYLTIPGWALTTGLQAIMFMMASSGVGLATASFADIILTVGLLYDRKRVLKMWNDKVKLGKEIVLYRQRRNEN